MRWLDGVTRWMGMSLSKLWEMVKDREYWHGVTNSRTWLSGWTIYLLWPPGSSVHGILQARILKWVASPFPRYLPDPGIKHMSLALQADSLLSEPPGNPAIYLSWLQMVTVKYIMVWVGYITVWFFASWANREAHERVV